VIGTVPILVNQCLVYVPRETPDTGK
jgi:hypothetical protein